MRRSASPRPRRSPRRHTRCGGPTTNVPATQHSLGHRFSRKTLSFSIRRAARAMQAATPCSRRKASGSASTSARETPAASSPRRRPLEPNTAMVAEQPACASALLRRRHSPVSNQGGGGSVDPCRGPRGHGRRLQPETAVGWQSAARPQRTRQTRPRRPPLPAQRSGSPRDAATPAALGWVDEIRIPRYNRPSDIAVDDGASQHSQLLTRRWFAYNWHKVHGSHIDRPTRATTPQDRNPSRNNKIKLKHVEASAEFIAENKRYAACVRPRSEGRQQMPQPTMVPRLAIHRIPPPPHFLQEDQLGPLKVVGNPAQACDVAMSSAQGLCRSRQEASTHSKCAAGCPGPAPAQPPPLGKAHVHRRHRRQPDRRHPKIATGWTSWCIKFPPSLSLHNAPQQRPAPHPDTIPAGIARCLARRCANHTRPHNMCPSERLGASV